MTYAEIEELGKLEDFLAGTWKREPVLIAKGLSLSMALRMVDELGFGHCVKDQP